MQSIHLLPAVIVLSLVHSAFGATVYESGLVATTQAPTNAFLSDSNYNGFGTYNAVRFTISGAAVSVSSITLEGLYIGSGSPGANVFNAAFFGDGTTIPGTRIASDVTVSGATRTATGVNVFGSLAVYHYVLDLSAPVELVPGTYWLAVAADTSDTPPSHSFAWTSSADAGGVGASSNTSIGSGYLESTDARTQVFSLQGAVVVPEPSAVMLGGLALLGVLRRKR
jgi:hypothetical protein